MEKRIEGPRGQFLKPSLEEQVKRLQMVVAMLATEIETRDTSLLGLNEIFSRQSIEEMVEITLYPERF